MYRYIVAILLCIGLIGCTLPDKPYTPPESTPIEEVTPPQPEVPVLEPVDLPDKEEIPVLTPQKVPVKFKEGEVAPTPMGCKEGDNVDC